MASVIQGIPVVLTVMTAGERDGFNATPKEATGTVTVDNVLVSPASSEDVATAEALYGKRAAYTLAIPKGDDHDWTDTTVQFFGQTWRTIGYPTEGIEANIPLDWNRKVMVERYG